MSQLERFKETITSYQKHGWKMCRVLMCEQTSRELNGSSEGQFEDVVPEPSQVDAIWFTRPSHAGREAWELRLIDDTPYALFETFEKDCDEEVREETLREMQVRLTEYAIRD